MVIKHSYFTECKHWVVD